MNLMGLYKYGIKLYLFESVVFSPQYTIGTADCEPKTEYIDFKGYECSYYPLK